ncbi:hypothetical protein [Bacillus pseudomycoides]|uniref:hypothetical protein n=1 Tax=Bacillus pseudomycoides TaxID=64104 RepID=UPI001146077F|nr:hypothetical protein [Bacillus pseudomycoides]
MLNIDINRLTDICLEYQQSRLYVSRIPEDFLSIAKKRFSIPKDDRIIAFETENQNNNERVNWILYFILKVNFIFFHVFLYYL